MLNRNRSVFYFIFVVEAVPLSNFRSWTCLYCDFSNWCRSFLQLLEPEPHRYQTFGAEVADFDFHGKSCQYFDFWSRIYYVIRLSRQNLSILRLLRPFIGFHNWSWQISTFDIGAALFSTYGAGAAPLSDFRSRSWWYRLLKPEQLCVEFFLIWRFFVFLLLEGRELRNEPQ